MTAIFTGLRASELRGLRWADVDLDKRELHVRQRADRYSAIGKPKSEAGERTVPLTPIVVNTLREWKLACPKSEAGLVFSSIGGLVEHHKIIVERGLIFHYGPEMELALRREVSSLQTRLENKGKRAGRPLRPYSAPPRPPRKRVPWSSARFRSPGRIG